MATDFTYTDRLQRLQLSYGRLATSPSGSAFTLLFVHGGFHGAWCWSPFLAFFQQHNISTAALDLRGHGGLPTPPDFIRAGAKEMAADIAEAAAALQKPIVLVSHSMGALAAMAASESIKPAGFVLIAPAPPANVDVRTMPPLPDAAAIDPPPPERMRRWLLQGGGVDLDPYRARLCPESPAFLNDCYRRTISVDPSWVNGPTLCLSGALDDSPLHPAGQDEAVAAFYGAELHKIPGAGHCLMLDATWETSAQLILDWLKRHKLTS